MIVLSAATYTLQLVLSAGTADVDVSYVDRTATAYPIGATEQTAATATTQTICSAPAASTSREIDFLSVKIKTTGGVVTVQKLNSSGSVTTQLISVTLLDEEVLVYTHGSGWCAVDANGNRKEATSSTFGAITVTNLTDSALTSGRVVLAGTGGLLQDSSSITHSAGNLGLAAGLTLSGTASNIALGSNFISNGGTDAGLSLDASNNATFSARVTANAGGTFNGSIAALTASSVVIDSDSAAPRIIAVGPDSSTAGTLVIAASSTDGSPYAVAATFTTAGINGPLGGTTPAAASVTTLAASGITTVGTSTASTNGVLIVNGATTNDYGAQIRLQRGGTNKWILGNSSAILGGASDALILYDSAATTTMATFTTGTGMALTGTLGVSPPFGSGIEISPTTDANNTATYLRLYGGAAFYSNRYVEISVFNKGGSNVNDMVFKTGNLGTVAEAMRLTYDGHLVAAGNGSFAGTLGVSGIGGIGAATSSTTNLNLAASTTGVSTLRVPHGSAPSSPVNGDMWTTTAGLFVRINGATVGPLS